MPSPRLIPGTAAKLVCARRRYIRAAWHALEAQEIVKRRWLKRDKIILGPDAEHPPKRARHEEPEEEAAADEDATQAKDAPDTLLDTVPA